jgi:hypothetical protein
MFELIAIFEDGEKPVARFYEEQLAEDYALGSVACGDPLRFHGGTMLKGAKDYKIVPVVTEPSE